LHIALGSDHAGFQLKESLKRYLDSKNLKYTDFGTFRMDSGDYPEYAYKVSMAIIQDNHDRGILICGTGIGMCIAANKIKGIRAALAHDINSAQLGRLHNDANILCLGGRDIKESKAMDIVDVWLNTSFEGGRHQRRIDLINKLTGL
jgi:ribose 5-phosphate isomerase B